jgi:hypothetical protein
MTVHVGERPFRWGRQIFLGPRKILSRGGKQLATQKTRQVKGHLDSSSIWLPTISSLIYSLGVPFPRAGHAAFSQNLDTGVSLDFEFYPAALRGAMLFGVDGAIAKKCHNGHKNERRKETLPIVSLLQLIVTSRPLIGILSADRPRQTDHLQGDKYFFFEKMSKPCKIST